LFFHNNHDGTFTEEGIERGLALNSDGMEQAGMAWQWPTLTEMEFSTFSRPTFADDTLGLYQGNPKGTVQ